MNLLLPGAFAGFWRVGRVGLLAGLLVGCVNRGQHAPDDDAGRDLGRVGDGAVDRTGSGGARMDAAAGDRTDAGDAAGGQADGSAVGGRGGAGGQGAGGAGGVAGQGVGGAAGSGAGGRAGLGGSAGTGAGGRAMDAGIPDVAPVCSARFSFENGNHHGAFINTGYQTAFTALGSGTDAACGGGSLRLDTTLTPTADKGEVIIPLGATEDVSGKSFSISVKSIPAATPNAYVIVFLVPSYAFVTAFTPIPGAWTTSAVRLGNGADAGTRNTTAVAVQVLGRGDSYTGALYLDEIDLR